jgi:hypothetical protein
LHVITPRRNTKALRNMTSTRKLDAASTKQRALADATYTPLQPTTVRRRDTCYCHTAVCKMQCATCNMERTASNMRAANVQHAAHDRAHVALD